MNLIDCVFPLDDQQMQIAEQHCPELFELGAEHGDLFIVLRHSPTFVLLRRTGVPPSKIKIAVKLIQPQGMEGVPLKPRDVGDVIEELYRRWPHVMGLINHAN